MILRMSIMYQFDVACKQKDKHDTTDEQAYELKKLAGDIETEELVTQADGDNEDKGPLMRVRRGGLTSSSTWQKMRLMI